MAEFLASPFGATLILLAQGLAIIAFVMISLLFLVYGDRKIWAAVQMRRGPNVVGPWGLLQSVADALKYVLKEIIVPAGADKFVFFLAPFLSMTLAMFAFVVIPFSDGWVMANINVGVLFIFAVSSLEVYGVIISAGTMNLSGIVESQRGAYGLFNWYWFAHLPMLALFFISCLAETNRPPFDLAEAESELVAGHMVEYSSTPYLLYMAGEYIAIFLMCALISILFFCGWLSPIPGLPDGALWMVLKMWVWFFMFAMVKAIVPRYRYDQLMRVGWKVFLPLSLVWVVLIAFLARYQVLGGAWARWDHMVPIGATMTGG